MKESTKTHGAYLMRVGQSASAQKFNTVEEAKNAARERSVNGAVYVVFVPQTEFRSTVQELNVS